MILNKEVEVLKVNLIKDKVVKAFTIYYKVKYNWIRKALKINQDSQNI